MSTIMHSVKHNVFVVGLRLRKVSVSQVVGPRVIFVPGSASTMLFAR